MFFEHFMWEEEKLGLLSGISFVLIGVFAYLIYLLAVNILSVLFLALSMVTAALTSVLFQLPRLKGSRPAISTFLGGMAIGVAVILWVIAGSLVTDDILKKVEVFTIMAMELILSFFAVGFLILGLYPPGSNTKPTVERRKEGNEEVSHNVKTEENEIEEDIFERL